MTIQPLQGTLPLVVNKLAKGLLIAALALSLGTHWMFLQSLAWAGMLVSYTQQAGLVRGMEMTFDGDHPCALCKTIEKSKAAERKTKTETVAPSTELKLDLPPVQMVIVHPPFPRHFPLPASLDPLSDHTPELPPPRAA